jgi:hypothetical protein
MDLPFKQCRKLGATAMQRLGGGPAVCIKPEQSTMGIRSMSAKRGETNCGATDGVLYDQSQLRRGKITPLLGGRAYYQKYNAPTTKIEGNEVTKPRFVPIKRGFGLVQILSWASKTPIQTGRRCSFHHAATASFKQLTPLTNRHRRPSGYGLEIAGIQNEVAGISTHFNVGSGHTAESGE